MSFYDALGKCTWSFNLEPEADMLYCFSPSDACESILRSLMVSAWSWEPIPPRLRLLETVAWSWEPSGNWAVEMEGTMDYSLYYASLLSFSALRKYACMGSAQFSLHFQKSFWEMVLFPPTLLSVLVPASYLRCGVPLPSGTSISTSCCRMLGFSIPLNLAFYVDFRGWT